jgi:hypothetical protein
MLKKALAIVLLLGVLTPFTLVAQETTTEAEDLSGIKTYLLEKVELLQTAAADLEAAAQDYYALAEAAGFDYAALWASEPEAVSNTVLAAKAAWVAASPLYEQVEGIVAGVPSLAEYDVILDAGASGEEDPEGGVPFDLTLPDGTVLERPGNLFGLLESTLWATRETFTSGVEADLDASGELDFGEVLPEAGMLVASAEALRGYVDALADSAAAWEPTSSDAFTALVVMIPTMSEYFASWKDSRFVAGDASTQADFVVISRLSDIIDILGGLEVVYTNVSPQVADVDAEGAAQIADGLTSLRAYVADLYEDEQAGRQFTAEEADFFGTEAQDRAQTLAGQVAQAAALLAIPLAE